MCLGIAWDCLVASLGRGLVCILLSDQNVPAPEEFGCPICKLKIPWDIMMRIFCDPQNQGSTTTTQQSAERNIKLAGPFYRASRGITRACALRTHGTRVVEEYTCTMKPGILGTLEGAVIHDGEHGDSIRVSFGGYQTLVYIRNLTLVQSNHYRLGLLCNTGQGTSFQPGFAMPSENAIESKTKYTLSAVRSPPQTVQGYSPALHEVAIVPQFEEGREKIREVGERLKHHVSHYGNQVAVMIAELFGAILQLSESEPKATDLEDLDLGIEIATLLHADNLYAHEFRRDMAKIIFPFPQGCNLRDHPDYYVQWDKQAESFLFRVLGEPRGCSTSAADSARYEKSMRLQGGSPFATLLIVCGGYLTRLREYFFYTKYKGGSLVREALRETTSNKKTLSSGLVSRVEAMKEEWENKDHPMAALIQETVQKLSEAIDNI